MKYCPYCGFKIQQESQYCGNCGKKIPQAPKNHWKSPPDHSSFNVYSQRPLTYHDVFQPYYYRPESKAGLGERFIALLIDSCIAGGLMSVFCIGWLYQLGKDSIREGQSIGKGIMGLRVIDLNSGMPATITQSFIRNCLCGCVDASCCFLVALIDEDGRRIGDHMAGTVVIIDQ